MNHIETGNTKLSLPVLVAISNVLNIQTDELLYDMPRATKTSLKTEIKAIKISLDKYSDAGLQ